MCKFLLAILLSCFTLNVFSQNAKDSIVLNIPLVDGKVNYNGEISVPNQKKPALDSITNKWFLGYFKYRQAIVDSTGLEVNNSVYSKGVLEYSLKPYMVKVPYYAVITLKINCNDGKLTYEISDVFFRPSSGLLYVIGLQSRPEFLIDLYKKKHIPIKYLYSMDRKMIRDRMSGMDMAIKDCIASLTNAVK